MIEIQKAFCSTIRVDLIEASAIPGTRSDYLYGQAHADLILVTNHGTLRLTTQLEQEEFSVLQELYEMLSIRILDGAKDGNGADRTAIQK